MKKYVALAMLLGATTIASGREPILIPAAPSGPVEHIAQYSPTPAGAAEEDGELHPVPAGSAVGTIVCDACDADGLVLYDNVKVIQSRKIHPCAVPKIVQVPNPCYDPCKPCYGEPCVLVEICVPPCGCEEIYCTKNGKRMVFDYGDYAVKVTARHNGKLYINYDN